MSDDAEGDGGDVEGVGHKVKNVPHVPNILLESYVPQLLDFTPYQA
jgi:hypothetical protein